MFVQRFLRILDLFVTDILSCTVLQWLVGHILDHDKKIAQL